jgi:hypothetical protein
LPTTPNTSNSTEYKNPLFLLPLIQHHEGVLQWQVGHTVAVLFEIHGQDVGCTLYLHEQ